MEDDTSPRIDYHTVMMTVNGVTKSVLVPMPKPRRNYVASPYSRPYAAKLPDGSSVIFTSGNKHAVTVGDMSNTQPVVTASSLQVPAAYSLLRQHLAPLRLNRPVMPVKPVVRLSGGDVGRVVILRPRSVASSAAVRQQSQSVDSLPQVQALPPTTSADTVRHVQLPISLIKPTAITTSSSSSSGATRPIILRKSQPVSRPVVRPFAQSTSSSVAEVVGSLAPLSSEMTVISRPRTLSQPEAVAAGWYTGSHTQNEQLQSLDIIHQATSDDCADAAVDANVVVRHIVPMDTDSEQSLDIRDDDELKRSSSDLPLCDDTEHAFTVKTEQFDEDRIVVVNSEMQTKVIEIFPDGDANVPSDDRDEEKKAATAVMVKNECVTVSADVVDDSSFSTETAPSDTEISTASSRDNYVVLAEWSQDDDLPAIADKPTIDSTELRNTPKHRQRQRRYNNWFRYGPRRKRSASSVHKARRTGGPPKTAQERYGIVECFVSLPVLRLKKPSADVRNVWRYLCCRTENQPCRCAHTVPPHSTSDVTPADGSKVGKLVKAATELIQPSLVASDSATLPVHQSGPTSPDGITPLLVRQPDGKLANVVAKRASPGGTVTGTNKKKYLLIKTKTGSYLVPVSGVDGESAVTGAAATTTNLPPHTSSPSPTSSMKAEPAVVSDSSGHRERIQQLKERLRQQEEQLQNIRSQLSCGAVNKFDL